MHMNTIGRMHPYSQKNKEKREAVMEDIGRDWKVVTKTEKGTLG